ncbi:hypothetical protein FRC05_002013 [Tulasnella sp. 425]|nr:hypothetical protein FRC05_002013 [Tulasnella sp. 425]
MPSFPLIPFGVAVFLATHGLRKKSLSPSGALTAMVVGFLIMAAPLKAFGIALIVFYLTGSRATKVGKEKKAALEEGHMEAGYRDGWQVLSNSFTALVASTLWSILFAPDSVHSWFYTAFVKPPLDLGHLTLNPSERIYSPVNWCAVDRSVSQDWSRKLVFVALGHFACCLGDTLASELGVLSQSPPILLTTFKRVPPGTNGALSVLGTSASALGGAVMGLTLALSLLMENPACASPSAGPLGIVQLTAQLIAYGAFGGLVGSLIDSLLGATLQRTRFSLDSKRILQDHSEVPQDAKLKVISGWNILTNNQVNVVSSVATALLACREFRASRAPSFRNWTDNRLKPICKIPPRVEGTT